MKYISTAMDPKGKIPEISRIGKDFKYQGCGGICLGIWLVFTGTEINGRLKEIKDPNTDNGMEITNQINTMATIVPKGIAPDE